MNAKPESEYPRLKDFIEILTWLAEQGFGDLPAQILIVPDSTLQAIAKAQGHEVGGKPALMVEFGGDDGRIPVSIMSADRLAGGGMPTVRDQ